MMEESKDETVIRDTHEQLRSRSRSDITQRKPNIIEDDRVGSSRPFTEKKNLLQPINAHYGTLKHEEKPAKTKIKEKHLIDIDLDNYTEDDIRVADKEINELMKNQHKDEKSHVVIEIPSHGEAQNVDLDMNKNLDNDNGDDSDNVEINRTSIFLKNNSDTNRALLRKGIASKTFRKEIIEKYIRPGLEHEISTALTWRDRWIKISSVAYCVSEILSIIQTALGFTAATYQLVILSFLAGIIGVISIGFTRFGAYSKNQSSEKTIRVNELFEVVGIQEKLPDMAETDKDKK